MNTNKREHITSLFVKAMYFWYTGDKLNGRNAMTVAAFLAKELGYVSKEEKESVPNQTGNRERDNAKVLAFDIPTKRVASTKVQ